MRHLACGAEPRRVARFKLGALFMFAVASCSFGPRGVDTLTSSSSPGCLFFGRGNGVSDFTLDGFACHNIKFKFGCK